MAASAQLIHEPPPAPRAMLRATRSDAGEIAWQLTAAAILMIVLRFFVAAFVLLWPWELAG